MSLCKIMRLAAKKIRKMAKNSPKKGKSARNGNAPSPYTKYKKTRYYYSWERKPASEEKEKRNYKIKKAA